MGRKKGNARSARPDEFPQFVNAENEHPQFLGRRELIVNLQAFLDVPCAQLQALLFRIFDWLRVEVTVSRARNRYTGLWR
jgi:hypothetical protein